ncbi:MAG: HDOD domain-containing protein [Gammaproteobacteria bacterium]|nr:HDOD domain-containing protein [Gammaproteobacteria bacterium]
MLSKDELVQAVGDIPPLSSSIVSIMNMLNSGIEIDFLDLENKIIQEPGLTGRVLKLANSPFYGMTGEINSIKEACLLLGLNSIRNLVISSAIIERFPIDTKTNLDFNKLWHHSVATAASAKVLSRYCNINPEQSFTAGLLHDIGKMIFEVYFTDQYKKALQYQNENDCLLFEAERKILGTDHSELGALTAEQWRLPENIIHTIRYHHDPRKTDIPGVEHIVYVSNIVARGLGIGFSGDNLIPALDPIVMETMQLNIDNIKESLGEIEALTDGFMTLIS